jgi:hypothetical protein
VYWRPDLDFFRKSFNVSRLEWNLQDDTVKVDDDVATVPGTSDYLLTGVMYTRKAEALLHFEREMEALNTAYNTFKACFYST